MYVDLFVYLPAAVNIVEVEELLSREVGVILERKSKYKIGEAGGQVQFPLAPPPPSYHVVLLPPNCHQLVV